MKTALMLLISLISVPIVAGGGRVPRLAITSRVVTSAAGQPVDATVAESVYRQFLDSKRARVHSAALNDVRSARGFVIPAAGSAAGGGGALFFRSDVTLANYNNHPQNLIVVYWAAGTSNPPTSVVPNSKQLTLPASSYSTYIDFVATVMGKSGIGALVFIPVSGTTVDDTAAIDALSRIYTRQPGSTGTVSQEFPAVDVDSFFTNFNGTALGLRQDAGFRTNFGFVNFDPASFSVQLRFVGEKMTTQSSVTVPAYGMVQTSAPAGDYGALNIEFDANASDSAWTAYGTSTDNLTGDGWVSVASFDFNDTDLKDIGFSRRPAVPRGK